MTNDTTPTATTATIYDRGRITHYDAGAALKRVKTHLKRIREIGRDLTALRAAGDEVAVAGAIRLQREFLMDMLAITPMTIADLEAKQRCLVAHRALLEPSDLFDAMVGTALRIDYRALALTPEQEGRMHDMLPDQA